MNSRSYPYIERKIIRTLEEAKQFVLQTQECFQREGCKDNLETVRRQIMAVYHPDKDVALLESSKLINAAVECLKNQQPNQKTTESQKKFHTDIIISTEEISDLFKEGDVISVKVLDINPRGQIKLSRRATLSAPQGV